MCKVAIHGYEKAIPFVIGPSDSILMGATYAQFPAAMDDMDARILCRQLLKQSTSPIGRVVVYKKNVRIKPQAEDARRERPHICRFFVSRNEDQGTGRFTHLLFHLLRTSAQLRCDGSLSGSRLPRDAAGRTRASCPGQEMQLHA